MKPIILSFCLLLLFRLLSAQPLSGQSSVSLQSNFLFSDKQLPFWLEVNRLGTVSNKHGAQQLWGIDWQHRGNPFGKRGFSIDFGASLNGRTGNEPSVFATEYWGKFYARKAYLLAGAQSDPVYAEGLSLSNGDLFQSRNARPLPRVEFGASDVTPFPSGGASFFSFDFKYAEHFLIDDRIVSHPGLHHKWIRFNFKITPELTFRTALDHWVFWDGYSSEYGDLPGFNYYWKYVRGKEGGDESPETDQNNVAGNQLGQYVFQLNYHQDGYCLDIYWHHLFEDRSGMEWDNAEDGYGGLALTWLKETPLLKLIVMEYVHTMDQSGAFHLDKPNPENPARPTGRGRDNYFNNSVYRSGFVAYNRMMGLPLFVPTINEDGVSVGFASTRLWGIHSGFSGYFSEQVQWTGMMTWSRYFGNYGSRISPSQKLFSLAVSCQYQPKQKPISYSVRMAADLGDYEEPSLGVEFSLRYQLK
ncbi:capsule assembly Wzi family protein [Gaoshiqia sediminis]|uniref:Capsule assembly Wzi family protein n=1 Tax=Gaoshiqia sediminis TaxID=2986998 RepID=A0AA42C5P5_9BACT|nr:capsule assembly Wzi family protein [Gaoshiqia sediminis]MCW0481759.1 capsule assembly Wzi family protein [Gaoshiqia sediminis]